MVYEEDRARGALPPRLRPAQVAEENWVDILGLYKWKVRQRERLILGEGVGDNYYSIVLRAYGASDLQLPL